MVKLMLSRVHFEFKPQLQLLLDIRGIDVRGFEYSRFTYYLLGPKAIAAHVQFLLVKPDSRIRFSRIFCLTH